MKSTGRPYRKATRVTEFADRQGMLVDTAGQSSNSLAGTHPSDPCGVPVTG